LIRAAQFRFAESRLVLALDRRQILRRPIDRRRISFCCASLRIVSGRADKTGDRTPLGVVGIEQGFRRFPGRDQGELPPEIERVMDPAVHAVTLNWAACMRRVAGEQHTPRSELGRHPGVRVKKLGFVGACERRARREHFQAMLNMGLMCLVGRIAAKIGPPSVSAYRYRHEEGVEDDCSQIALIRPVPEAHIGYNPLPVVVMPRKANTDRLADLAVRLAPGSQTMRASLLRRGIREGVRGG
jgi:hypothetical protein